MKKRSNQDCFFSSGDLQPENNNNKSNQSPPKQVNKMIKKVAKLESNTVASFHNEKTKSKPTLSLTLTDLSIDSEEQVCIKSPLLAKGSSPLLNTSHSPSQGSFWRQVLSTTPPTGRKPLTPILTSSSTFFPNDLNGNNVVLEEAKRRHSLPTVLEGNQGVPKITPQLDYLFQTFLVTQENWDVIMEDIAEVDLGRGSPRLKCLLQKEKSHQPQNHSQPPTSSTSPPLLIAEVNNANSNVDVVYVPQPHQTIPMQAMPAPWPSESVSETRKATPVAVTSPNLVNKKRSADKVSRLGKDVPRFFWPQGKPTSNAVLQNTLSKAEYKLKEENNCVTYDKFGELIAAAGIPMYWKKPFWMALSLCPDGTCSPKIFIPFLRYLLTECPDDAARFVRILSSASRNFPGGYDKNNFNNNNITTNAKYYNNHGNYCQDLKFVQLTMTDFVPMIQDIIDTHPGLGFLRDAPEFHSRYITTVISRIFYKVNRSWSGRLTLTEIRRSNLLRIIKRLEEETDINTITEYFSYEHFYVIYCKFWELDKDHDLLIDKADLAAHAEHAMSSRILNRIFSGTVLRGWDVANPIRASHDKMTYSDFVWFLISEEDKKTPTAIEYWFRCLDLDGDGVISPYELQYFYSEQENRIEGFGIEPINFSNVYCQIVDMLHCSPTGIRLKDLKTNPFLAANVFNTVFNLEKYLEHEQRDPFAAAASLSNPDNGEGESDWDKYAAAEYELLIAEESPGDHLHDSGLEEMLTP